MIITQQEEPDAFAMQRADAIEQLTLAMERLDQLDIDATTLPPTLRTVGSRTSAEEFFIQNSAKIQRNPL